MRNDEIQMIDETMRLLNREVIGAIYIDYPIYLLHLEYKKRNDDPMFFIDWAIIHFVNSQSNPDFVSVSKIIGMDYRLVQYRIKILKEDGMLIDKGNSYKITDIGKSYFFNEEDETPYVNASSDFLIDGKDLSIMPDIFYEDKGFITFNENSIYPRTILKGADDMSVKKVLSKIERMSDERKIAVGLPAESKDFRSVDAPSPGLLRLFLVFSCDHHNNSYKDIVYSKQIIDIPSLKEIVGKAYFKDGFVFNYGYDTLNVDKLRDKVFVLSTQYIKNLLSGKDSFYWNKNDVSEDWFSYGSGSQLRPLSIILNMDNFSKNWNRRALISYLNLGYREFNDEELFFRLTVVSSDESLTKLIDFDKLIEGSKMSCNLSNIDDIYDEYGEAFVRKSLVLLDRLDFLETIDNRKYINQEERK